MTIDPLESGLGAVVAENARLRELVDQALTMLGDAAIGLPGETRARLRRQIRFTLAELQKMTK
jgi:hypothetical protein